MTEVGPTVSERRSQDGGGSPTPPPPRPAVQRAGPDERANMVRSLLPLVLICLVIVGWTAFRQGPDEPVQTVDPSSTVQLAAARASYPMLAPQRAARRATGRPARAPTPGTPPRATR